MASADIMSRRSWRTPSRPGSRASHQRTSPARPLDGPMHLENERPRKRLKVTDSMDFDDDLPPDPTLQAQGSISVEPDDLVGNTIDSTPAPVEPDNERDEDYGQRSRQRPRRQTDTAGYASLVDPHSRPRSARARQSRSARDQDNAPTSRPTTTGAGFRPRYSTAAAATAATQAQDNFKPREERSWEEFHPDLDPFAQMAVFTADQVDGRTSQLRRPTSPPPLLLSASVDSTMFEDDFELVSDILPPEPAANKPVTAADISAPRRSRGRPHRGPDSMLTGLGIPQQPRIVPLPTQNPKEKLNLPKPSFRVLQPETTLGDPSTISLEDHVDPSTVRAGFQATDRYLLPENHLIRYVDCTHDDTIESGLAIERDGPIEVQRPTHPGLVEYDMDEQDGKWLLEYNKRREQDKLDTIRPGLFEMAMTQIEREYYALERRIPKQNARHTAATRPRSGSAAAVNGEPAAGTGDEPDSKCAICDDGDCENANAIIFCDGCDLAVHQECYGVPFIPEGQWFCHKCKEVGRGTPTCIFCPNVDGAFKQTSTNRWSHLLCAIWIPEVTIANPTFMDSIQDVDRVPRTRWALNCYICNQRMGACVQCSNKACYQAFHVTCARRANLYLRMKSNPTSGLDVTFLKALCDKHVSLDWRQEHDVDNAILQAKHFYRKTFKHRRWADSQMAATTYLAQPKSMMQPPRDTTPAVDEGVIVLSKSEKRTQTPRKTGWKLPSGAPVVPDIVYHAVEWSLSKLSVQGRRDFLQEICKYWTLKREARRPAALLKRLQLQLESFPSMDVIRRNFAAMGAAGGPKLLRRIDFAETIEKDLDRLQSIVQSVHEREQKKAQDAEQLQTLLDTVYFPIPNLLWPVYHKALKSGGDKVKLFEIALKDMERKLQLRQYTSAVQFSVDLGAVVVQYLAVDAREGIQFDTARDVVSLHNARRTEKLGALTWSERQAVPIEEREPRAQAKRIIKAVFPMLQAVLQQESELKNVPVGLLNEQAAAIAGPVGSLAKPKIVAVSTTTTDSYAISDYALPSIETVDSDTQAIKLSPGRSPSRLPRTAAVTAPLSTEPRNPDPIESTGNAEPWLYGGVPWYLDAFDPVGTTIHEERETVNAQDRAVSEPLSEMDEETLQSLEPASTSASVEREREQGRKSAPPRAATPAKLTSPSDDTSTNGVRRTPQRFVSISIPRKTRASGASADLKTSASVHTKTVNDAGVGDEKEQDEDEVVVTKDSDRRAEARRIDREKKDAYNARRKAQRRR